MKKILTFTTFAVAFVSASLFAPIQQAEAQVNCGAARTLEMRRSCRQRQIQIYQDSARAYDRIDQGLARTQRFYQGVDAGMRAGTYGIQRATRGRVPAYRAYKAGRAAGNLGYRLYNRR